MSKTLQEVLIELDYEPYSYTGRGMTNKKCVAINISHPTKMFEVGCNIGEYIPNAQDIEVKYDTMGMEYVMYFPYETYDNNLDKEENEEDAD